MALDKGVFKERLLSLSEQFKKADKTMSERDVCRRFIEPLFEALGWNLRSDEVKEQVSQPAGRPDYVFYLEGKIAFFLEAKKHGELDDAAIKQAVNYGRNRTKRWVVLSNFQETIILVCDIREDSIRKHVFRWVSLDNLDEAVDGLLLLSRENFLTGGIDSKAQSEGRVKKTVTVDDELLDDIWSWRTKLIKSIKESNKKEYTSDELEEIAQTILNRIIFIRTAEDRHHEAKPDETISNIIEAFRHGKAASIAERMNKLFKEYDGIYDSKLFTYSETDTSKRHECELVNIGDNTYFEILKGTYYKNELYSYNFGDIPADILGSMYEKYIGRIQSHRKEQGIYYTPTYIVDYIVRNTLGELLKTKKPAEAEKLKVLDMACGSGSFLLRAFEFFDEYHRGKEGPVQQTELDTQTEAAKITRRTKILRNNIFGVDLDKKAVEIAQLNLLLKAAETRHRLPMLNDNIQWGNSLIDDEKVAGDAAFKWNERFPDIMAAGGFDVVIGNPPYVQLSMDNNSANLFKTYLINRFKSSMGRLNTFGFFIKLGIDLLAEGGKLGYIIPNTILTQDYYEELREMILENCKIESIVTFSDLSFKDAVVENVIIILKKSKSEKSRLENVVSIISVNENLSFIKKNDMLQSYFIQSHKKSFNFFDKKSMKLKEKLDINAKPLREFLEVNQAIALKHERAKYLLRERRNERCKKVIDGRNIRRYSLRWGGLYLNYDVSAIHSCKREDIFLSNEKIFFRRVGDRLIATLDKEKFYALNTLIVMNKKPGVVQDLKYMLGLFNSNLPEF